MAGYDGSIRINTLLNTKGFESGSRSLISGMERLGSSLRGIIGSLGFGLGIAGLVALGKQAIDTASDIQEVQNVVDTAFGSMSYKMEEFAKTSVKQFGISQLSAKQLGSTFMAMGASMLDSAENASNMAINLTARAADMASFYNKSIEETSTALKSIYTGETESLKEYGVVMTQVNLQEFARQQGISKSIQKMTQAEKVELQYAYVMKQTSLAAGDFAKTSDSWANQTRILSEQFKELLSVLGSGLITVLTPVVKFLNTVLSMLIAIAKQIGAILSKLFGISIPTAESGKFSQDLSEAAGGANDLADGMDAAGEAAEKAGKAASKALAPFDKLNVLSKDSGSGGGGSGLGSGGGAGGGFEIPEIEMKETEAVDEMGKEAEKLMDIFTHLFNPFKESWEREGKFVIDSWKYALDEISKLLKQIGSDFLRVWDSPETINMLSDMLHIVGDIGLIVGNLTKNFREAWAENDVGYRILSNIRDIYATIVHYIRLAADATAEWSVNLDFSPLLESIEGFTGALIPLFDTFGQILLFLYQNVLLPLAGWVVEEAVPAFINLLSAALEALNEVLIALQPLGIWLWENFLQPLGEWAGDAIIAALETITDLLKKFGDWISEHQEAVQTFAIILGSFAAAWGIITLAVTAWSAIAGIGTVATTALGAAIAFLISPIGIAVVAIGSIIAAIVLLYKNSEEFRDMVNNLWEEHLKPVLEKFMELIKAVGELLKAIWENILKPLIDWIVENILPVLVPIFDGIVSALFTAFGAISDIVGGVIDVIGGIIQFLTGVFSGDWEKAWDGIVKIFEGVWDVIKVVINGILGGVEALANGVIKGINLVIRALNKINFTIPDWIPGLGGKNFGLDISELNTISIPRLADGAVIRGGDPFMAVLGDQPHGQTNIETPLPTMIKAFKQAIAESGGMGSGEYTFVAQLDGKTIFEETVKRNNMDISRLGRSRLVY